MHTFYYPDHNRHDPESLPQPDILGNHFLEIAKRGQVLIEAVQQANLGPMTPPGDFGIEPISEIHEHGMLSLLQNAYDRLVQTHDLPAAIPDYFQIGTGRVRPRKPRSLMGQLGYYCNDMMTPIMAHTWDVAYWTAQTALSAAALVAAEGDSKAYALCRPPGHHAGSNFFGGYCYLNNAAIAAHWLVQQGYRVAVLDIDFHHGNGTQDIFYGRSDVLTCSIHIDPLLDYPGFWGYADEYGTGHGQNFNFNYPLPYQTSEAEYLVTLQEALEKIRLFVPDQLVVSLGVDALADDPLGGFDLSPASYGRIAQAIAGLKLPTIIVQEGGYNLETVGTAVVTFLQNLV